MRWIITICMADLLFWFAATVDGDVPSWLQIFITSPQENVGKVNSRSKRSLYNFQNVIQCFQPWSNALSHYGDYGCYCGYRGYGQPLDDTDKCCFHHDHCYDKAENSAETLSEKTVGSYFSSYNFDCINNKVTCRANLNTKYQQSICECDRQAGECFLRNRKSYSSKLFNIDTGKYCGEKPSFDDLYLGTHTLSKLYSCNLLSEHDSCCVDKGYNSVYKMCCGGSLRSKSSNKESIRCCGNRFYDPRLHICCYGVLHPNALHMECCGVIGAKVDMTIAECIDGKPVPKENTRPLNSTILL